MRTQWARTKLRNKQTAALATLLFFSLTSCGDDPQRANDPNSIAPFNGWQTTYGGGATPQSGSVLGNYTGTLTSSQYTADGQEWQVQQPFTLVLGTAPMQGQDPSRQYATMNFTSSGQINASSYVWVDTLSNGIATSGGAYLFRFRSVPAPIQGLTTTPVAVEFQITLQNGYFNPAQSWIRILDCGFSRGGTCSVPFTGATLSDFRKL